MVVKGPGEKFPGFLICMVSHPILLCENGLPAVHLPCRFPPPT
jgi:hypothetical protein